MTPRKINNPSQSLPDEKNMNGFDLAKKYTDRNVDVSQKASGFVKHYLPPTH